jgi:hypothetical protein
LTETQLTFHVKVFSVLTPYIVVVGYQRFRGPRRLHIQGDVAGVEENGGQRAARASETFGILQQHYMASQEDFDLEHHRRESLKTHKTTDIRANTEHLRGHSGINRG